MAVNYSPCCYLHSFPFDSPSCLPSLTRSPALSLSLPPSFLHWLASRLSTAVSVALEFKHCSLQQHMKTVLLGNFQKCGTTKLSLQGDFSLSGCFSAVTVPRSLTGVRSSIWDFIFFRRFLYKSTMINFKFTRSINPAERETRLIHCRGDAGQVVCMSVSFGV